MGYYEAVKDNIPHEKDSKGFEVYYPPCCICGASVRSWNYNPGKRYVCGDCRQELVRQELNRKASSTACVKEAKLKEALKRIAKVADINLYAVAIDKVRKGFHIPLYYQSTEEIMTALELMRRNVMAYHQVKVYDYRVDFVLPEYKVALEIDGELYHTKDKADKSALRDDAIVSALGKDWEVIHIKAENINTNITRLIPAIKAVLKRRKQ